MGRRQKSRHARSLIAWAPTVLMSERASWTRKTTRRIVGDIFGDVMVLCDSGGKVVRSLKVEVEE